ncbi:MAG: ABC transporter ATP-binding protein [Alphaproteobacteria bacterium]
MSNYVLEAKNLTKIYQRGSEEVNALNGASFNLKKGEICSIVGPSGSGKTTLVNILGCLDNPTSGELILDGNKIFEKGRNFSEKDLTKVRRIFFGYVFQKFFLIPTLTVLENVAVPLTFSQKDVSQNEIIDILKMLGLEKRMNHLPSQLSGGEMQRVAIARALISKPLILLADEPTGNLDSKRSGELKQLFLELNSKYGLTIVVVTHDINFADIGNRVIELCDGKIIKQ